LDDKQIKLKEIEELLETYGGEIQMDAYVLKYLSLEELEQIKNSLLKKQSDVIEDSSKWLKQFKKVL